MEKIDHIGIAVRDMDTSVALFEKLLNTPCYKTEFVESEKVQTAFFKTGESKVELISDTGEAGVVNKFIDKRGEGIHHIALQVEDIYSEISRLKALGFQPLSSEPKPGADGKLVCFLHPSGTNGVLIELVTDKK